MTRRPQHEFDGDGACIHCGFDGAEEYHLRVVSTPKHARLPKPDSAIYCEGRRDDSEGDEFAAKMEAGENPWL